MPRGRDIDQFCDNPLSISRLSLLACSRSHMPIRDDSQYSVQVLPTPKAVKLDQNAAAASQRRRDNCIPDHPQTADTHEISTSPTPRALPARCLDRRERRPATMQVTCQELAASPWRWGTTRTRERNTWHGIVRHPALCRGFCPSSSERTEVRVHPVLGLPEATIPIWDGSGTSDYWKRSRVNIGYNNDGVVDHVAPRGRNDMCLVSRVWHRVRRSNWKALEVTA